jgi:hypothetical protein
MPARCLRTLAIVAFAIVPTAAFAQLELPRPSPGAKVTQTVGLTDVTVDYSSPGVKGRKIWGAVVPYDKVWRTGANQTTRITFSRDAQLGNQNVPAGTYALFTIPGKSTWTVILSKNVNQAGTGQDYKQSEDQARIEAKPQSVPMRERMTFLFGDTTDAGTNLELEWEKLRITIPIHVATDVQAMNSIKQATENAWRVYANAARYMLESKKDYTSGLSMVDQSLKLKEDWYNDWIKAELLAAQGKYRDAYPLAEKAKQLGGQAPQAFFLSHDVDQALADWKKKI